MFLARSEYDRGVNTFSPEGRLFQVEYAIEAIKLGTTVIGIQTSEGVIVVAEKRINSTLLDARSIEKMFEIDSHIFCCLSGVVADSRLIVEHARVESQNHRFTFDEPITVGALTQSVCDLALRFAEDDDEEDVMSRPFGIAMLFAGVDDKEGPVLYYADPSGTFVRFLAKAIGAATEGAQTALQEQYDKSMTLDQAELLALSTLKEVMEEKMTPDNVDVGVIRADTKQYRLYEQADIERALQRLEATNQAQ
eukprot:GCRY01001460.1.p1 GENE.GCRY01001460.1~~GCRY01001460.1.p1  ORF type:complete len:251 (+),score=37.11 GCRY01001460.1:77-829(+)